MPSTALVRFLPFLKWPRPTLQSLQRDGWAGISVGLILIPQAIAYAGLAGMPPQTGLYAALLPSLIGILFGSSALLSVGPVALTSILVFGSLSTMATPLSPEWVTLAIWLSVYSGVIQFALGAFSLGRIANLVSQPVLIGFINAAATIIILSQLPVLLGLDVSSGWRGALTGWHDGGLTAAFGLTSLLMLVLLKRFLPAWPGLLIVTVLGIVASRVLDYAAAGGATVGPIAASLPSLELPQPISLGMHQELWPAAVVVALISFTEAMTSCRVLARKRREIWDEDQELIGQGMAKLTSGLVGAFPVSGSFSRSAMNLHAGAQSGWSTLFSALAVLMGLLFLTEPLADLPRATLAAIIIVPVYGLLDLGAMRRLRTYANGDAAIALTTFVVTLASTPRMHWGVFAGVALAMINYLHRHTRPRVIEVSLHPDGTLRDASRFSLPPLAPDVLAVRIDSALNFLSSSAVERFVQAALARHPETRRLLLCFGSVNSIDATGVDLLETTLSSAEAAGIEVHFTNVKKQVWDVLERAGVLVRMPAGRVHPTDHEAIEALNDPKEARAPR